MNHPDVPRSQGRHAGGPAGVESALAGALSPAVLEQSSLEQVIGRLGPMAPRQAATVGLAVLDQLVAVHNQGMLHGDVRPGSVLLGPYDQIILGTPTFRSPTFTAPEGVTGPAADLWSLGATLYTAVEGRPPSPGGAFDNAGPIAPILFQLLSGDPAQRPDPGTLRNALLDISRNGGEAPASPVPSSPADPQAGPSGAPSPDALSGPIGADALSGPIGAGTAAPLLPGTPPAVPPSPAPSEPEPIAPVLTAPGVAPSGATSAEPSSPSSGPGTPPPGPGTPPPPPPAFDPADTMPPQPAFDLSAPPDPHGQRPVLQTSSSPGASAAASRELVPVSGTPREAPASAPRGEPTGPTERSGRRAGVLVPRSIVALTGVLLVGMAVTIGVLLTTASGDSGQEDPAEPVAGGKGLFATVPRACSLLDDKQAGQVVPGFKSSEVETGACDWLNQHDWRKPNTEKFDLRVRLVAQKPDASGVGRAKEYLSGKRTDFVNNGKFATPKPAAPQNLKGIGEEAFVTGVYSPLNIYGGSYKATVVFRVGNLIAQVDYERGGVKADGDGKIAAGAQQVARWLTQSLKTDG
ncbi:hypothetical protein ACQPYK_08770 [Streptosporangium sp. CA-135522]|uniref:hypothetical protein n=1 Tax=Streptosporangium sp. CA-135522 TaxID=3240072 RepID=UPI003D8CB8C4